MMCSSQQMRVDKHLNKCNPTKKNTHLRRSPSTLMVFCISLGANAMRRGNVPAMNRKEMGHLSYYASTTASHKKATNAALNQKSFDPCPLPL